MNTVKKKDSVKDQSIGSYFRIQKHLCYLGVHCNCILSLK